VNSSATEGYSLGEFKKLEAVTTRPEVFWALLDAIIKRTSVATGVNLIRHAGACVDTFGGSRVQSFFPEILQLLTDAYPGAKPATEQLRGEAELFQGAFNSHRATIEGTPGYELDPSIRYSEVAGVDERLARL
jgi:hypothetical protein